MAVNTKIMFVNIVMISFFFAILIPSSTPIRPENTPSTAGGTSEVPAFVKDKLSSAITKTNDFIKNVINKKMGEPNKHQECLKGCKELYEGAIDDMKEAIEALSANGDFSETNSKLSRARVEYSTCIDDCSELLGDDITPFDEFSKMAEGLIDECKAKTIKH